MVVDQVERIVETGLIIVAKRPPPASNTTEPEINLSTLSIEDETHVLYPYRNRIVVLDLHVITSLSSTEIR